MRDSGMRPLPAAQRREDPFYAQERIALFPEKLAERFGAVTHRLYDGGHRIPSAALGDVRAFLLEHA